MLSQVVQWNLAQLANAFVKGELLDIVSPDTSHNMLQRASSMQLRQCISTSDAHALPWYQPPQPLLLNSSMLLMHAAVSSGHPEEILGGAVHRVQWQDLCEAGAPPSTK